MMKIFSGSEILAVALKAKLEQGNINTVIKNNLQSARLAGFGNTDLAVELFIDESLYGKAFPIIEEFKMSI